MSERKKLLGVDYGTVRIGLAVTDPDRKLAFPLTIYRRRDPAADATYFRDVIRREEIGGLVIGLPLHTSGREGQKAAQARAFGRWLAETTGLPAVYFDERFTTTEAEAALWSAGLTHGRRKERRDAVAAQIMLQSYLEAGCPTDEAAGPLEG